MDAVASSSAIRVICTSSDSTAPNIIFVPPTPPKHPALTE